MAIDETGLTKGLVRKLNALRKSVGDDLADEVFAKWLERQVASQAKSKPDPVAMKIVEALAGFENDPKFNLGNHGYTPRRAKGKGASGFIAYRNEKAKEALAPSSTIDLEPLRQGGGGSYAGAYGGATGLPTSGAAGAGRGLNSGIEMGPSGERCDRNATRYARVWAPPLAVCWGQQPSRP